MTLDQRCHYGPEVTSSSRRERVAALEGGGATSTNCKALRLSKQRRHRRRLLRHEPSRLFLLDCQRGLHNEQHWWPTLIRQRGRQ